MILNVSGRTDIVAFYTDWFLQRIKEGYVMTRNPFNKRLISKIYFKDVDAIIFCTKNPTPIIDRLDEINKPFIFHITITPYKNEIEKVNKKEVIESVKKLKDKIGKDKIYIRYDPIFISDYYTIDYHIKAFNKLCTILDGCTENIIVSFLDIYKNVLNNKYILKYKDMKDEDYKRLGEAFSKIAKEHNITVGTCCEKRNLIEYGFVKQECMSLDLAFKLTGKTEFKMWKERGKYCNCVAMVDIGEYNTCKHFCKYCYANFDESKVLENISKHDKNSPLLVGNINKLDEIKIRK